MRKDGEGYENKRIFFNTKSVLSKRNVYGSKGTGTFTIVEEASLAGDSARGDVSYFLLKEKMNSVPTPSVLMTLMCSS